MAGSSRRPGPMRMRNRWLHRCAILLAAAACLSVFTGAAVTSNEERPLYSVGQYHLWLSVGVTVLAMAAVLSMRSAGAGLWLRRLAWMALAGVATEAVLGVMPLPQAPAVRIAHACLAESHRLSCWAKLRWAHCSATEFSAWVFT